jgi:hypothetical protein
VNLTENGGLRARVTQTKTDEFELGKGIDAIKLNRPIIQEIPINSNNLRAREPKLNLQLPKR